MNPNQSSSPTRSATPPGDHSQSDAVEGLRSGALSGRSALGLAISAFIPAVTIATTPAYVASVAGNAAWLAMLLASLATTAVALAIIVFARRYVVSGSIYSYVGHTFGPAARLVTAGSMLLAFLLGTAFIVVCAAIYATSFLTGIGFAGAGSPWFTYLVVVLCCVVGGVATVLGVDISKRISIGLMAVTLPPVLIVTLAVPFTVDFDLFSQLSLDGFSWSSLLSGVVLGSAVIILFESSSSMAAETANPRRTLPRIVLAVPLGLGLVYMLATVLQVSALDDVAHLTAAGVSPIAALAEGAGLGSMTSLIDGSLAIAAVGGVVAFVNYGSRVVATVAADGTLPQQLAVVHPRRKTPARAAVLQSTLIGLATCLMLVISNSNAYEVYSFSASVYTNVIVPAYVMICVAAVVHLKREGRPIMGMAVAGLIGVGVFVWGLISSIINPAPYPGNLTPYVALGLIAVLALILFILRARRERITA